MKVAAKYVVYRISNPDRGGDKVLDKVHFPGVVANWFDSEQMAIQALVDANCTYEDFIIVKQVFITT